MKYILEKRSTTSIANKKKHLEVYVCKKIRIVN